MTLALAPPEGRGGQHLRGASWSEDSFVFNELPSDTYIAAIHTIKLSNRYFHVVVRVIIVPETHSADRCASADAASMQCTLHDDADSYESLKHPSGEPINRAATTSKQQR